MNLETTISHLIVSYKEETGEDITELLQRYLVYAYVAGLENKGKTTNRVLLQYTKYGDFVARHPSVSEAARRVGVNLRTLSSHLAGKVKFCKGCTFEYENRALLPYYKKQSKKSKK